MLCTPPVSSTSNVEDDLRMRRVRQIEEHDAVDAVRRALARHHRVARVGRDRDVVDRARVHLDRVRADDVREVRDVEDVRVAVAAPGADDAVVAAVLAGVGPEVGRVRVADDAAADDRDALPHVARRDFDGRARVRAADRAPGSCRAPRSCATNRPLSMMPAPPGAWRVALGRLVDVAPGDRRVGDRAAVRALRRCRRAE